MKHGVYTSYGQGCRCDKCRDAHRQAENERRWFKPGAKTRTVVPGWRDQFCPVCEAGPFVQATTHVIKMHGIPADEIRRRWGTLSSEAIRLHTSEQFDKLLAKTKRAKRARLRRWAALVAEEVAQHPDDVTQRCARRWRISYNAAALRLLQLRKAGLTDYREAPPRTTCRRGHPLDGDNVLVNATSGNRQCKTCVLQWRSVRPNNCAECGTPISRQGTRCKSCVMRLRNLKRREAS